MEFFASLAIAVSLFFNLIIAAPLSWLESARNISESVPESVTTDITAEQETLTQILDMEGKPSRYYRDSLYVYEEPPFDGVIVNINGETGTLPNPEGEKIIVLEADPETFKVLNSEIAMDANHVFGACSDALAVCNTTYIVKGADPTAFRIDITIPNLNDPKRFAVDDDQLFERSYGLTDITPAEGIDVSTIAFVPIRDVGGYFYLKDINGVYVRKHTGTAFQKIIGAHPQSFEVVGPSHLTYRDGNSYYAKDHSNVYFVEEIIRGVDLETFKLVDNLSSDSTFDAEDKNHKYLDGKIVNKEEELETIYDSEGKDSGYRKDDNYVYIIGDENSLRITEASPKLFSYLGGDYSRDYKNVYWSGILVPGADPSTFESFSPYYYGRDAHNNFKRTFKLGMDHDTFEVLDYVYYKDVNSVYFSPFSEPGWELTEADPATFVSVKNGVGYDAQDHKYLYANGEIVALTGSTNMGSNYWKNKDGIYYSVTVGFIFLEESDVATFVYDSTKNIGKDAKHVWHEGILMENADPLTIQQINDWWFKDKNNVYLVASQNYQGTLYKVDPAEFLPILYKNEPTLYGRVGDRIVCASEDEYFVADISTFEVTGQYSARDKNSTFNSCTVYDPDNP